MRCLFAVLLAVLLFAACVGSAMAQEAEDAQRKAEVLDVAKNVEEMADQFEDIQSGNLVSVEEYKALVEFRTLQETHKQLFVMAICITTPIFLILVLFFIRKSNDNSGSHIVSATGLVLVIQATVLIVLTSSTSEQLTSAIGVLGAIAGYLFGSAKVKG